MRMSISASTAAENDCHGQFLEKDVKRLGLQKQIAVEEQSVVPNRSPCLGCSEKSLIWPREAGEARSLRSHLRFHGHGGRSATGFPEGGNEDHITYPSA